MSRLWRVALAPYRLARAIRRKGLRTVAGFLATNLRQRGVAGAWRAALLDREARRDMDAAAAAAPLARLAAPPPAGASTRRAAGLDADYALDAARWAYLQAALKDAQPSEEALEPLYLVQGSDTEALAATRAALGRDAQIVEIRSGRPVTAPQIAADRFAVTLKAGDRPSPGLAAALARVSQAGVTEVVTFDLFRREGERVFPLAFPGANPTLLSATDYVFGRFAMRGAALSEQISFALDPRDRVLAWMAGLSPWEVRGRWRHVGLPLVEVVLTAADIDAARQAVLKKARSFAPPPQLGRVAVVICTKDKGHLLRQLVESLLRRPDDRVAEVAIVANGTSNPYALQAQADLSERDRVRLLRDDRPFNFSRMCNAAAREAPAGAHLLFLNDDIAPVTPDWLDRMLARLDDPAIGAVGPLLLYPNERVQHAGVFLGFGGLAGHTLRHARLPEDDYLFMAVAAREVSALTGAAMLVRREAFDAMHGFDALLPTFGQDIDLCLRLGGAGWACVFDPSAILLHMESVSMDVTLASFNQRRGLEHVRFRERWGSPLSDRLHPAPFDVQDETLRHLRPGLLNSGRRGLSTPP